jgi:hypothetical protein
LAILPAKGILMTDDTSREVAPKRGRHHLNETYRWQARLEAAYFKSRWGNGASAADTKFALGWGGIRTGAYSRRKPFEGLFNEETRLPRDVVDCLAKDPEFAAMADIAISPFFAVVAASIKTIDEAMEHVHVCLRYLRLTRMPVGVEEEWMSAHPERYQSAPDDDQPVEVSFAWQSLTPLIGRRPVELATLALLGALYREAYLTFELETAQKLGLWFWALLEEYLSNSRLDGLQDGFSDFVIGRVLYGKEAGEASRSMNPYKFPRLPGQPIGILLPANDPELELFIKSRSSGKK